mgnify:CR=1 FL=1|tara:strand:- start:623 stop:970 length:348 start_codon:yes stop_codon:yes gene_type:complete
MATISKQLLSGSTQGTGIKIVQTSTAGDTVHTAIAGTTDIDEIWIWACNTNTSTVVLTLEMGSADVDDNIKVAINPNETVLVVPGLPMHNGLIIKGFASVANKVNVFGYVNRMDI